MLFQSLPEALLFFTIKIALLQKARHASALVGRIGPDYAISIGLSSSVPLSLSKQHADHAARAVLRFLWRPQKLGGEGEANNKSHLKSLQAIPHHSIHIRIFHGCTCHSWNLVHHIYKQLWPPKDLLQFSTEGFWFWSALLTLKIDHICLE